MNNEDFISTLSSFGLTNLEATIYCQLLQHGQMTGYEVVKETGISRSNVYSSLSNLVEKGAAYLIEGESTKYTPVSIKEFTQNTLHSLSKKALYLEQNAPSPVESSTGYITIKGATHIKDKISNMLHQTELRLYILAENSLLEEYRNELTTLVQAGKKVVILSDNFHLRGAKIYHTKPEKGQLRFIIDSSFVLTGELTGSNSDTCLYSGQQNLVSVMKEALKNKIILLEN